VDEKEDEAEEWEEEELNNEEREDEEEEEVTNSAQQLQNVTFVAGRKIKDKQSILVDGYKYRYRMHQANKQKTRAWYRCVCWNESGCRSTAVLDMTNSSLMKVTASHNHGSYFLRNFVRYIYIYLLWSMYTTYWPDILILIKMPGNVGGGGPSKSGFGSYINSESINIGMVG
jgi:hypothetical protein